ncbi:hypothetical protein CISIN_1g037292mg, partial [Citrus sinensis]
EKNAIAVSEALKTSELESRQGMNQEITLKRSGDTRWRSHYGTLISIITMFSSIVDVFEIIANDASNSKQRFEANSILRFIICKLGLQRMREHGWNSLLSQLNSHFNEVNTKILLCLACLCPKDSFVAFNKEKLLPLAQLYPKDFSPVDLMTLDTQLNVYIIDMQSSVEFSGLSPIGDLAQKNG